MSETNAAAFFKTWQTYRKVVAANYMYHIEIQTDIERLLRSQSRSGRPFSLLDLGCGDAATLAPLLANIPVRHYKGVDLSEAALALAADNLKALSCPANLTQRDILVALETETDLYDVIYTSFALHHLTTEQKAAFFRLCAQRLDKGGLLVLADVVREEDESLPLYLARYCEQLCRDWSMLEADEKASICEHIQNNDRPETFAQLRALGHAAGFADAASVAQYSWHRVLSFRHGIERR